MGDSIFLKQTLFYSGIKLALSAGQRFGAWVGMEGFYSGFNIFFNADITFAAFDGLFSAFYGGFYDWHGTP